MASGVYKRRTWREKKCLICGTPFWSTRYDARFDSPKCRKAWSRYMKSQPEEAKKLLLRK